VNGWPSDHFLPRRNRFLFKVHVPADFGDDEVVWTLTSPNGETKRAYGTLHPDYFIDNSVLMANNGGGASGGPGCAGRWMPRSWARTVPSVIARVPETGNRRSRLR